MEAPGASTSTGLWIQHLDKEYITAFTGDFAFDFGHSIQSQAVTLNAEGFTWRHELFDYTNTVRSLSLFLQNFQIDSDAGQYV